MKRIFKKIACGATYPHPLLCKENIIFERFRQIPPLRGGFLVRKTSMQNFDM